jgi:hypothetical protein
MTGNTWEHKLDCAKSVEDVVAAGREFLARFDPQEINSLPAKCRPPPKLVDPDDIGNYAYELVRNECDDRDAAEIVHRLARFFSHASIQIARLHALERTRSLAELEAIDERIAATAAARSRLAQ